MVSGVFIILYNGNLRLLCPCNIQAYFICCFHTFSKNKGKILSTGIRCQLIRRIIFLQSTCHRCSKYFCGIFCLCQRRRKIKLCTSLDRYLCSRCTCTSCTHVVKTHSGRKADRHTLLSCRMECDFLCTLCISFYISLYIGIGK